MRQFDMQPKAVQQVIAGLKDAGVTVVCYLPDSLLKELYPALDLALDTSLLRRLKLSIIHLNGRISSREQSLADAR